jgi:uncharacterized protein YlxW (UPF0749 family)
MLSEGMHPGLQLRAEMLAARIDRLKQRLRKETGRERIDDAIEIEALERRYKALQERLRDLDRQGGGLRVAIKSAMAQVAYDFTMSTDAFIRRLDSAYRSSLRSKAGPKS